MNTMVDVILVWWGMISIVLVIAFFVFILCSRVVSFFHPPKLAGFEDENDRD